MLAVVLLAALAADPRFTESVYPILQKANCRGCHVADGVASATRLHFPDPSASPEEIEAFGRRLGPIASLFVSKPTGREKHTGGVLIPPGSPQEAALAAWASYLERLGPVSGAAPESKRAPLEVRRLTHAQYNR
ncbi:MAG: hypothetical protein ACRD96_19505, partial [Bryobacteraceae bacterium]